MTPTAVITKIVRQPCPTCKSYVQVPAEERKQRYVLNPDLTYRVEGPECVVTCPKCSTAVVMLPGPPD